MPATPIPFYQTDLFRPSYRPLKSGPWELRLAELVLCSGYWSPPQLVSGLAVLVRQRVNGQGEPCWETWMSLSPKELESQEIGVRLARGRVVIFGLGMGWSAAASALRDEVSEVIVVELDADVLALHRTLDVFAQLPPAARAKISLHQGDAHHWHPEQPVDLLMPDIWQPLVSDGRVEEVRRMQTNVQARAVYFWGQELEIARHARAAGRALDAAGISATIADFGLPLIGPEDPDYPWKLQQAAERCLQGRWLPGTELTEKS